MPEQITKYPEITIQILKESGARCGEGVERKILKKCPPQQFCALPTGEVCIYGIEEIPRMTQVSTSEVARVVCPHDQKPAWETIPSSITWGLLIGAVFAVGLATGALWRKSRG